MTDNFDAPEQELVQKWMEEFYGSANVRTTSDDKYLAARAARWGAEQELEACCKWLAKRSWQWCSDQLREARRPKPPSLKKQALVALELIEATTDTLGSSDVIRQALEALPDG